MLTVFVSLGYSTNQLSFILNPDSPSFMYTENQFNDSNIYNNFVFIGNQNKTTWVGIPKNSTIMYSNISLRGESTPIQTYTPGVVYDVAVDNVITSTSENEITVGVSGAVKLLNSSGNEIWSHDFPGAIVNGVAIGNLTADEGNEIVAATDTSYLYLLKASDGSELKSHQGNNIFNDVAVGNVTYNTENEIAAACEDGKVYLFNNQLNELWNYSTSGAVKSVAVGDVNSSIEGNEVIAGDNAHSVYLLNSSGNLIWGHVWITGTIRGLAIGDVNKSKPGNEITVALDNTVYLLDADNNELWHYQSTSYPIASVTIGDVTNDNENEIIIGSRDNKVYVLNPAGQLVLSYSTSGWVQGVAVGSLTADPGNEVVAGSLDGHVYILNFEYYPTNVYLDIGGNGNKDWQSQLPKLRDFVNISDSSINTEIQNYLSSCTSQVCNIPLVFHSDSGGDLNVTSMNITYNYDASEAISSISPINAWSRTNNTEVNESVGNQSKRISYAYPANNIEIRYVNINNAASACDFAGERYSNGTIGSQNFCNITTKVFTVSKSGVLPSPSLLWDNSMSSGIPVWGRDESSITTPNGKWTKNFTVWNETPTIFYNVTANISVGSEVTSSEGLFVYWYGNVYDITPTKVCPNYDKKIISGDNFYVCKQDTEPDGVVDFFKVKQPHTSAVTYTVNGSINSPPVLNNSRITPNSDIWGNNFSFYVDVYDHEGNNVTVNLWVYHVNSDIWERIASKNTTRNTTSTETLVFNVTSTKSWVGQNQYLYEYQDFNGTEYYHPLQNTSVNTAGPNVLKHNTSVSLIEGNNTSVNRVGSGSTRFTVVIKDSNWNQNVSNGVNCSFWITKNRINFILANYTNTNSSGFCTFMFDPDSSYLAGQQWWKAGAFQDAYYNDNNSTNYTVNIYGELNINLTNSVINQNFTRGQDSFLTAKLVDENLNDVYEPGYTCTWYINNIQVNITTTNDTGYCYHVWKTDCSSNLSIYLINVTLSGGSSGYYTITNNKSITNVTLKGNLNATILLPKDNTIFYERQNVTLNSTVTDECGNESVYSNNVTWYTPRTMTAGPSYCPKLASSTKIADGFNTTWKLEDTCTPRYPQIIIANATGDLYNSNKKNVSIYIFGFANIQVTTPADGSELWRNASYGLGNGLAKVVCRVTSNASGLWPYGYPVNFWDDSNPLNDAITHTNVDDTNVTGHAEIVWNISSNITVPEGNHTIKCNISDQPNLYFNTSVADNNINVTVKGPEDWLSPVFLRVSANSVEQYKENVTIEADVYDIWGVDKVWVKIMHPDGTNQTNQMTKISSLTWSYSENFTNLGDYDFIVFANDTSGNLNQTSSWFEVYPTTVRFYGNTTDVDRNNVSVEFIFYRNGTNWMIYTNKTSISNAKYDFKISKRIYDIDVRVFNQSIKFLNINMSNDTVNSVYNFDFIPQGDIPPMYGPRNRFIGLALQTILNFSYANLTLNYTGFDPYNVDRFDQNRIHVFKCSAWNYSLGDCFPDSGSWVSLGGTPYYSKRIVSVIVNSMSCFVVGDEVDPNDGTCDNWAERCIIGQPWYDITCCGSPPNPTPSPGPGPGPNNPSNPTAVCGNGKCEVGENSQNCPKDCGAPENLFSVRTNLTEPQLNPGEEETYALWVTNNVNYPINVSISTTGSITKFINLEKNSLQIDANKEEIDKIYVTLPSDAEPGTYTGHITVTSSGKTETLPVTLTVSIKGATYLDLLVESRNKLVSINETARFRVTLYNYGLWKNLNLTLNYYIKDPENKQIFYEENEGLEITQSKTFDKAITLSKLNISVGKYIFNVTAKYDSKVATAYDDFEITESFWTTNRINMAIYIAIGVSTPIIIYFMRKRYIYWKLSKARYIFPIDFRKLPTGKIWLGKIAETNKKAYFDMNDLRTHVLTAGATGSGKSVSAMIFIEELLKENIPVIVFDPTAQWSGFVRPCKDPNLIKYYKEFGLTTRDTKPYNGMIYEVTDPNVKIDFDKYMNPGEVTVFMLNKLKPGEYDDAVKNIIDTIFAHGWEESTKLRMAIVFDEVHRLLEKYGGKGGYVSLERACREFRKWGIGIIMASQVLSDFKEAIKGNVLTEIQLHTKSLGDLGRVEKKYGLDYVKRVTRLEVGVGMVQNPKYNEGRPWFVAFRPTLHEPHKIPDVELQTYKEYAAILVQIEAKIDSMEKAGKDVFDLKTEFKLAQDKLKKGRFRMAKIYIDSLRNHLLGG
jgi:hypothetical protein